MADPLEDLLRACTVRVTGGPAPGAGFFAAPGKVLTCVHVIGDSAGLVVRWERDGQLTLEAPVSGRVAVLAARGRPNRRWTVIIPTSRCWKSAGLTVTPAYASIR